MNGWELGAFGIAYGLIGFAHWRIYKHNDPKRWFRDPAAPRITISEEDHHRLYQKVLELIQGVPAAPLESDADPGRDQ